MLGLFVGPPTKRFANLSEHSDQSRTAESSGRRKALGEDQKNQQTGLYQSFMHSGNFTKNFSVIW